ncbi:uncharacterized protein LOC106663821 isoform X2 [Cimex lectularius]|uniref:Uncharacterized protein n=1 Tax=Cimex lectularius TaxID=79782 RepID=A0A8I6REH2_CIMLE|nr:uncharacterized protein LOC106663821 isoform X2 [Cimex lectularius]
MVLLHTVGAEWSRSTPMRLFRTTGKRQHLPYHPVARFRGADSRPYFVYDTVPPYQEYEPPPVVQDPTNLPKLNAGELLALLFSGLKDDSSSRMRGTLRFGIVKR